MTTPRTITVAALRGLLDGLPDDLPVLLGDLWGTDEEGRDLATAWEPTANTRLVGVGNDKRVPCLVLLPSDDRPESHTVF